MSKSFLSTVVNNATKQPVDIMGRSSVDCQSKSCELLHNSIGTTCTTSPEQNQSNGVRELRSINV